MLRIKEVRKANNVTARELAMHINVAESTMSLYENGKREPDFKTLLKISEFLNVSIDYLLGNDEQKEPTVVADDELGEDVIIFHRDGKTQKRKFTKEQMAMFMAMVDAIPETPDDQ